MYNCFKCTKIFKNNRDLQRHINRKIPCDNIIKCGNCNKVFNTNQQLNNHINRKNKCIKINLEQKIKDLETRNEILQLQLELTEEKFKNKQQYNNIKNIYNKRGDNIIGYVYIITNLCYEIQNIYKIGKTKNLKQRISGYYNTGKTKKDKFQYVFYIETEYYNELEKLIFEYLVNYKVENEMYKIKLSKLKNIINNLNSKIILEKKIFNELEN